jgi:hypothetical protein
MRVFFSLPVTVPVFAVACGVYTSDMASFMDRGMPRASFELGCPKEQLQVTDLGHGTMGVRGCGKQAVYKEVSGAGWVNNTGSSDSKAAEVKSGQ